MAGSTRGLLVVVEKHDSVGISDATSRVINLNAVPILRLLTKGSTKLSSKVIV